MKAKTKQSAFTLIELLVVIAIIGILATLAIIALQQARQNARDAKRVADVKQVSTALELYFNDNQAYPETLEGLQTEGYMQQLPEAPSSADGTCSPEENDYNYVVDSERGYYQLSFCTGKQVSDMSPGVMCMTPGGLSTNCSAMALAPDPNPFCDPSEEVTFVDDDGDGYLDVHTCCELGAIRNNPSADYELVNNIDCSNSENWVQDITYGGITSSYNGFITIKDFLGNINGNNYVVDGIYFTENSGIYTEGFSGLLEVASGADVSVSNLNINNAKIVRGGGYAASFIAPYVYGGISIDNCSLTNSLVQQTGGNVAGGFVGIASGSGASVSINDSHISNLTVENFVGSGFGGMVGILVSNETNNLNSITNSSITNSDIVAASSGGMGGMVYMAYSLTISDSYVSGLDFDNGSSSGAGGLAYQASYTTITNSYVKDSNFLIPGNGSGGAGSGYAGFFPTNYSGNIIITDSYTDNLFMRPKSAGCGSGMVCALNNNSSITNSYVSNLNLVDDVSNGGLAGLVNDSSGLNFITDSYVVDSVINNICNSTSGFINRLNSGGQISNSRVVNTEVTSTGCNTAGFVYKVDSSSIDNSGFIDGSVTVTGIGSSSGFVTSLINSSISNSYVKNSSVSVVASGGRVSGFVADGENSTISDSFFEGSVSGQYSTPTGSRLAGFSSYTTSGTSNSYFSGELTGTAEFIDCFATDDPLITESYYNNTRCTFGSASSAVGLSDTEMKTIGSYTSWNINNPSCSEANDTNPWRWTSGNYPCLYSDPNCSCS